MDRIGLLFTHFKTTDGKSVYMPNSQLTIAKIENHQRSEEVFLVPPRVRTELGPRIRASRALVQPSVCEAHAEAPEQKLNLPCA